MSQETAETIAAAFEHLVPIVGERLSGNRRIRRNLPGGGRLFIDRQLPFLCVYREPTDRDDAGTRDLVTTEASYLFASGAPEYRDGVGRLCREIAWTLHEHFGAFLFVEIWSAAEVDTSQPTRPRFRIRSAELDLLRAVLEDFGAALREIRLFGPPAEVELVPADTVAPPGLPSLLSRGEADALGCFLIGLEVWPVYRQIEPETLFPVVLQRLRRQLARALRRAFHTFAGDRTSRPSAHFEAFGPRALIRAVGSVDRQLAEVADSFDFLLQVTPVNADEAWSAFRDRGFDREPTFYYRPLPYRPEDLKRRLFEIPVERIEDPTLEYLLVEKQVELDRQISILRDLGTRHFLLGSLQLYGGPEIELMRLAEELLDVIAAAPPGESEDDDLDAPRVAALAEQEIASYRRRHEAFAATVTVRDDIGPGIMVSRGHLLVAESSRIKRSRINALLQHEVGTHLVTYYNGGSQPLQQLHAGLAGYESLQEGLAVLSEYLVGGLSRPRVRTLAARVVAARYLLDGAGFVETFRRLHEDRRLPPRAAFTTTMRIFRGGGLTKDIIYLRGLRELLAYLSAGHEIEPLFVGKIALSHVPFIRELRRREILRPAAILPHFLEDAAARRRLESCRGLSVVDLVRENPS